MADSRQFKSTDTSTWTEKYGDGSDGAASIDTSTFAEANETFTGTTGESTGTAGGTGIANNDCVLIHQTQGTNADADPNWELNKVVSGGGTTDLTFKHALTRTYSAGAQILKLKQYSSLTINTSQTLTGSTWNGSKGGIVAWLVNGIVQGPGIIQLSGGNGAQVVNGNGTGGGTGRGFRGGHAGSGHQDNSINAACGEDHNSTDQGSHGGGGGGSVPGNGSSRNGGGAGGGNGVAGTNGSGGTSGAVDGTGGVTVGNAALTSISLGNGGGGLANHTSNPAECVSAGGGSGAGILILIAKEIKNTFTVTATGGDGVINTGDAGTGSSGAGSGGSILLKGQIVSLGSGLVTASGSTVGADGGAGRIHIDYSTSLAGTTTPTLDSTQDTTLASGSTGNFFALL